MGALTQLPQLQPRERLLRARLLELSIETQATANRMQAAGGACMAQSDAVSRAAWAMAKAVWSIGGNTPTLATFFPGVGSGKRPDGAPAHGDELEDDDDGSERTN